ncbi:hypothetical protein E3P92_00552 [Wallemia ichthyophaga]|uniref:Uncharacterized protein n=1 Tax=Wallemia ichthyophaga TaxID=245174 RepID=A0A4T0KF52_WALIC|nr:hypothetical protein E3P91_03024 [Wallemia ichthyophaga]TIA79856.1 hypothetical protein E3P98_03017 [Wallemia ichthyophaga]TIA94278.1 hypothetical protein E3P97_00292 [Wallemia ichthyophaga]TIB03465.1 hypothetical protein E3P95_00513 [Wallemia ichthyophaga]TIB04098.1 hypothetical protein E3P96_01668 [Wallemia ichthyophaga]
MAGSKNEFSGGASDAALKHEAEKKGLGTGPGHEAAKPAESTFKQAPVINDAPVVTGIDVNNKSHGTDSHSGAAGADGNIEVSGGAPTGSTAN